VSTLRNDAWRMPLTRDEEMKSEVIRNVKLNNETGPSSFSQADSDHDYRLMYTEKCGNLMGAKGQVGISKTSAFKIVEVQDLNLRLYFYSDSSGGFSSCSPRI